MTRPSKLAHGLMFAISSAVLVLLLGAAPTAPPGLAAQEKQEPAPASVAAAPRGKKLVLKDGSFHIVRSYEQKGERVRYYSLERSAWEEIPAALVDWEATRRAETEKEEKKQELVEKMKAAEMAARARELDVDASIEVAPGVFLPDNEGLYVIDGTAILPLTQVQSFLKADKGRALTQIFVPLIPSKHKVQIAGKQAVLRLTNSQPEFYFRTPDGREPEMELIRATLKGANREIQTIHTDVVGQQAVTQKNVSIQRWEVARGVYRLTISEALEPGEYALAELLPGEGMNIFVWDFGIEGNKDVKPAAKKQP